MQESHPIELALQLHREGLLDQAKEIYRTFLAQQPNDHRTLHLLGVAESQCGNAQTAADLIRCAIAIHPLVATYHNSLSVALCHCGKYDEAIAACQEAIKLRPDLVEAHINVGNILRETGRLEESISAYNQAISLAPENPAIYPNLGATLFAQGRFDDAISAYERAIQLNPNDAAAYSDLGFILYQRGRLSEAEALCEKAVTLNPDCPVAHNNRGLILAAKGNFPDAEAEYRTALRIDPRCFDAHSNLGLLLYQRRDFEDAAAAFREAIGLRPDAAEAVKNLGAAFYEMGHFGEAIEAFQKTIQLSPNSIDAYTMCGGALRQQLELKRSSDLYREAIRISPDSAEAHFGLSLNLLIQGDFQPGWREYEWRRKRPNGVVQLRSDFERQWDGCRLNGQIILLHTEQGFGDTIQFVRYAPLVAERGGRIVVRCQKPLMRLLAGVQGVERLISADEPLPEFDLHCPLLSLPLIFKTDLGSVPAKIPYLVCDPSLSELWRERLARTRPVLRVGLVWAGSKEHQRDRYRSIDFDRLGPLLGTPGAAFFSLQLNDERKYKLPEGIEFQDHTAELNDFADTAGLVDNMDLVIAVDTAVAHLAGAMGKRVWALLPFSPDWRWLLNREDSPWYPTMRLFRQRSLFDWDEVIGSVARELTALVLESQRRSPTGAAASTQFSPPLAGGRAGQ